MKLRITLLLIIFSLLKISGCFAQSDNSGNNHFNIEIPEIALLSLKSTTSSTINISAQSPGEAGLALDFSESIQSDVWINYSSILPGNGAANRNLQARINGNIPEGLRLKIRASTDAGFGGGRTGIPVGDVILSNSQQTIISGIGSCYTGVGFQKGHQLSYSLELDENTQYSEIKENTYTLTVLFTLIDQD